MSLQLDLSPKISSKLEKVEFLTRSQLVNIVSAIGCNELSDSMDLADIIRIDFGWTNRQDKGERETVGW